MNQSTKLMQKLKQRAGLRATTFAIARRAITKWGAIEKS